MKVTHTTDGGITIVELLVQDLDVGVVGEIKTELDGYVSEVDAVVADQLPELERLLKDSGVSYVMVAGDDKQ